MIHPTAIIDPQAKLGPGVTVGPYSVIGPQVEIGEGTEIANQVTVLGPTRIGKNNRFYTGSSIGQDPQDKKYRHGEDSRLEMGDGNTVREFCTINRGTELGGGLTRVGHRNWIMATVHIAHDVIVGDDTVIANNTALGGHAIIGDKVVLGGFAAVHQFCRIGAYTITGAQSMIPQDVPPFLTVAGNRAKPYGVNSTGLERNGFTPEQVKTIQKAYKIFYRSKLGQAEALERLEKELGADPNVQTFIAFIRQSTRGVLR
ncbi:MAG: acyl-ACP--UDP-N-acetylglucosamine O-acyltransferase [Deltaproteobacteria bacterium]|nr:acyl-ACP--UDP-N-acetylglucosamine O-acyltransferase [Deltaproteobacteria bacterium]